MEKFIREEVIRFQHIDYAGIVFYPRYLEMLNSLVEDWFAEALGCPFAEMHKTHGIPTVDLQVRFKRPARLGETIIKQLWIKELGKSSVTCEFIFSVTSGNTILEGAVTLVNVRISSDRDVIGSEAFNETLRQKLSLFLSSS